MNKFHGLLARGGDKILKDRAEQVATVVQMSQESLVQNLKKRQIQVGFKKKELLDMSPDNRYSLKFSNGDFNAEAWTQEYQNLCIQETNLKIELSIAEDNLEDLFAEPKK